MFQSCKCARRHEKSSNIVSSWRFLRLSHIVVRPLQRAIQTRVSRSENVFLRYRRVLQAVRRPMLIFAAKHFHLTFLFHFLFLLYFCLQTRASRHRFCLSLSRHRPLRFGMRYISWSADGEGSLCQAAPQVLVRLLVARDTFLVGRWCQGRRRHQR